MSPNSMVHILGDKMLNSIFLATDPVTVESIIVDYAAWEQTSHNLDLRSYDYLHPTTKKNLSIREHRNADGAHRYHEEIKV
jgi:hypothetical protein